MFPKSPFIQVTRTEYWMCIGCVLNVCWICVQFVFSVCWMCVEHVFNVF